MILAIGFAVFLAYAFPGYMSNDSVDQLLDARKQWFSNAHPPIMSAEWLILDMIVAGPVLMLLVQGGLFLGGLAGVLRRVAPPRTAALLAVAVLLFPPVLTTMAVIWKDSQMAGYILAGTAAMLSPRLRVRLIGLGLMTLGAAFRHNAFAASVPLIGLLFVWRPGPSWWKRYAVSGAAALVSVLAMFGLNRALTRHPVSVWDNVALADIAGVLNFSRDRSDAELREILRGTPLPDDTNIQAHARKLFSPRSAMALMYGDKPLWALPGPSQHAAIERAWRTLVLGDWRSYLDYRVAGFRELLGLSDEELWGPVWFMFLGYPELRTMVQHNAGQSSFQALVVPALGWCANETRMFRPYLYALLAIALLLVCARDRLSIGLLASGLLYELSYFPAANTVDFRYSHWMILCTTLAALVLFVQRLRGGRVAGPAEATA